ncbi:MAG TPA: FecR domain-containing protein [Novosphingobium sp.]
MTDHRTIEDIALWWLMRRDDPAWCEHDEYDLQAWIEISPKHAAAFWRLEHGNAMLTSMGALAQSDAVPQTVTKQHKFDPRPLLAAMILLFFSGIHFFSETYPDAPLKFEQYSTKSGQIAQISLHDGTHLALDTASTVRFTENSKQRIIWLDRGGAFLEVVRNPRKPLIVYAGTGKVTVIGTKFAVARTNGETTVSVIEGRVKLEHASSPSREYIVLNRGEVGQAVPDSLYLSSINVRKLQNSVAWRNGFIIFDDSTIEEVAEKFNLYNERKIEFASDTSKSIRIEGMLRLGNIEGFARMLAENYGIQVRITEQRIVLR